MSDPSAASTPGELSIAQCVTLACLLEATAPKVGNVHRSADFADMTFVDFQVSATVIGPIFEESSRQGVGKTVLAAIKARCAWTSANTNLGVILLLAPLAAAGDDATPSGVAQVLDRLGADDARHVYEAIRLAAPGGLGTSDHWDVNDPQAAPLDLREAMRLASDRDLVARQYAEGFPQVFHEAAPWIEQGVERGWPLTEAIVHAHVRLMASHPDTLIHRKCGPDVARRSARLAASVLEQGEPGSDSYFQALSDLDFWLRSDGNRRNPGATADLIAAGLYVLLRGKRLAPPIK